MFKQTHAAHAVYFSMFGVLFEVVLRRHEGSSTSDVEIGPL